MPLRLWLRHARTVCLTGGLAALLLSGCSQTPPAPKVYTDYDKTVDFSRYRTYAFHPSLAAEAPASLTAQRVMAAVQREMAARSYREESASPDLLVNFSGRLQRQIRSYPAYRPVGYYGYRGYGAWPGYVPYTEIQEYTEGTLNIDLIDPARNEMVWEGVAVGRIREPDRNVPVEQINQAVAEIFAKYPFQPPGR